jgi:phosphodiesterase/alkaline phosphatase D-like protein
LLRGRIADWFAGMESNRQESIGSRPAVKRVVSGVICGILALATQLAAAEPITRIALGSCADQDKPQPIWEAIVAQKPQLFLFLGDNVYADTAEICEARSPAGIPQAEGDLSHPRDLG